MANDQSQRDLVLAFSEYAFIQDRTQGAMKICTGPATVTPSQSDQLVRYDPKSNSFVPAGLSDVIQKNAHADEGSYLVLRNPSKDSSQPKPGVRGSVVDFQLSLGSKVVIKGPADFALWPQQSVEMIEGHHLKSNEYLLVRVYNDELARKNWASAVMKPATPAATDPNATSGSGTSGTDPSQTQQPPAQPQPTVLNAEFLASLTIGKLLVIKGTEVSFYIPPTGVEVLKEDGSNKFVRDALTLERMEYCILIDENGNKRYEKGPQVVFPEPTEKFQQKDGHKKQSAIELNDLQGLHLKCIADCDFNGVELKAGQEYFLTGAGLYDKNDKQIGSGVTIYYPQEEIAFVKYDGKTKIFAVTVPAGEGRYVLDRISGDIATVKGPKQLLPNPIKFVIVRRVLSDKQVSLMYPGNMEALAYNQAIAGAAASSPTTRAGAISEGDLERASKGVTRSLEKRLGTESTRGLIASASVMNFAGETSRVSGDQKAMGDEFERSSGYTAPRTLTLNTKYQGAVTIRVWTGYAVQVVSKIGEREVVVGPKNIVLDYDQELEALTFSTGKPKTTDRLITDAYLRVENNKISDIITVETEDHVFVEVYVSYKVNFRGDSNKWFASDNPVKLLCDHARSMLKGAVRKLPIEGFYSNSTDIIRNLLLGAQDEQGKRAGLVFDENGMAVDDVEVLNVTIKDDQIRTLLVNSQREVVKSNIELSDSRRKLDVAKAKFGMEQEEADARAALHIAKEKLQTQVDAATLASELARIANSIQAYTERLNEAKTSEGLETFKNDAEISRKNAVAQAEQAIAKVELDEQLRELVANTTALTTRLQAAKDGFGEAVLALSRNEVFTKVAESMSMLKLFGGKSFAETIQNAFEGSPVSSFVEKVLKNGGGLPAALAALAQGQQPTPKA